MEVRRRNFHDGGQDREFVGWSTGREISTMADRKGNFYDDREDRKFEGWRIGLKFVEWWTGKEFLG
jgi:hypothetical protein